MNAHLQAQSAYGDAKAAVRSPRQIEFQAFAQITRDLTDAAAQEGSDFPRLAAALHENMRLWTIVAADVAQDENELPEQLRAQFLYLAQFTRSHTGKVLKGEAEAEALIDVNTAIMKGLRQQSEAA